MSLASGLASLATRIATEIKAVRGEIADVAVPAGGTTGQILAKASDTDNDLTWMSGTRVTVVSDTPPVGPLAGDLWVDASTSRLYVFADSTWVEIPAIAPVVRPFTTTTVDYTVTSDDEVVAVDATSGARTITLPSGSPVGKVFTVKKIDATGNGVVVGTEGSELIDGDATVSVLFQYEAVSVISDGTNWLIV